MKTMELIRELTQINEAKNAEEGMLSIDLEVFDKEEFKGTKAGYPNVKFGAAKTQGSNPAYAVKAKGSKEDLKKLALDMGMSKKEAKEMYPELF